MFERFDSSSIRVIMLAQEKARQLNLSQIGSDLILYGIVAEGSCSIVKQLNNRGFTEESYAAILAQKYAAFADLPRQLTNVEIPFSPAVQQYLDKALETPQIYPAYKVTPWHIFCILCQDPDISSLFLRHAPISMVPVEDLARTFGFKAPSAWELIGIPPEAPPASQKSPRTINDWFTAEAMEVVSGAEDLARIAGSDTIVADHLAVSSLRACSWLPQDLIKRFTFFDTIYGADHSTEAGSKSTEVSLGKDVTTILFEAQAVAKNLGKESIGPEHLLVGVLRSVASDKVASAISQLEDAGDLNSKVFEALGQHMRGQISEPTYPASTSLAIDKNQVKATSRMVKTIRRAIELGQKAEDKTVSVQDMLRALVETAKETEVSFVGNRYSSLVFEETEATRTSRDACKSSKKSKRKQTDLSMLKQVLQKAVDHAQRLGSNRLDINHLGLALLDEKSSDVDDLVEALGSTHGKVALTRRLEWCLSYQRFRTGYQSEPGETIDLSKLNKLYPA